MSNFCIICTSYDIQHHGIKGQRWGIRRYQNVDGSYTKAGLERYNKAKMDYDLASKRYKKTKQEMSGAKKELKNAYLADEGKKLHEQGKRVKKINKELGNNINVAIMLGTPICKKMC